MIEVIVVDPQGLPVEDRSHILRDVLRLRNGSAGDEQGDDLELEAERGGDLGAQRVFRVVDAAGAGGAPLEPSPADQDDSHLAGTERLFDHLGPAGADADSSHVHEDAAGKSLVQPIVDTSGVTRRILTAVAKKDLACGHLFTQPARTRFFSDSLAAL
jgi:hypothetical protein